MARSPIQRLLLVLAAVALALPVLAKDRPNRVIKETVTLAVGEPMKVAYDGNLETCAKWNCFLWVKEKAGKPVLLVELTGGGEWIAWEEAAKEDDKGEEGAEGDDDDSASDDDDSADSWMDMPVLSVEERRRKAYEKAKSDYTVEKQRGKLSADGKWLVVPGDLLPTEDFDVSTNGFWGARLGEEEIGTSKKTGLVLVKR